MSLCSIILPILTFSLEITNAFSSFHRAIHYFAALYETFEKRSILFKVKEGENISAYG